MASIIIPGRWQSQPPYPVEINTAVGVSGAFTPALRGLFPTTSGSPSLAAGRFGAELRSSSNNAAVRRAAEPALLTPAASVMWVGTFYGAATTDGCLGGLTHNNTNASPYVGIELKRLKPVGGADNIYLTWNNSSTFNYCGDGASQNTTGEFVVIGSVKSGSQFILIKNLTTGAETYVTTSVSGNIGYGTAPRFEVGDSLSASRHPNAGCALLAAFNTAIDEAFARDLAQNPWQIFRPQKRVLYFDAGGGGYNLLADTGSFALTGSTAGLITARSVVTDSGSFVVTGNSTDLVRAQRITVDPGSLVLVGSDATLTHTTVGAFTLTADSGSFALTGNAAGLTIARSVTTDTGSFALTGNAATLTKTTVGAYTLGADLGVFTFDGQQTSLLYSRRAITATGSFALTGTDTALTQGYTLAGAAGSFVLDGHSANLRADRSLAALVDTFTLVGVAATLTKTTAGAFELPASAGVFAVAGNSAGLVYTPNNNYALTCDAGTFSAAGVETSLRTQYRLAGVTAGFTVTGVANQTTVARRVGAAVGAYALLGTAATLRGPTRLYADTAAFVFTGRSAVLAYSGYDPLEQEKYDRGVRVYHETTKGVRVSQSATDVRHKTSEVNLHVVN